MEMVLYKEAEEKIQVVVHGHCNMGLAILGRQVGHTHGSVVAVVEPVVEGMEQQVKGQDGKDVMAVGCHTEEEGDHTQALLAAREVCSKEFGDAG